ncbi:HypC/HybG/HupF family hydrogenase formation chaperone [Thermocrinis minervae]|uniref:Hydrogenase maturation protein HypC n=1 Tax=Thermocrinis minervae TaxID=381751 RepID=A0A1M6Q935_9AQUI|nr:HypC/HybG/HupF family hydrogenase formation chaperone [Thermocrinis minervae]SHK16645.1 Hydrogenase maturation protein HypC [Thermocrinis minervae]
MCLAIPSRVVEIYDNATALVEVFGAKRIVSLELMQEDVNVGDYVLVHVGFAIGKLTPQEAQESLQLFEDLIQEEL